MIIAPFHDAKTALREMFKGARRKAAKARPDAGRHAARLFLDAIDIPENAVVALYFPIRDELDTEPLAVALVEQGRAIALPRIAGDKAPLIFKRYTPGDHLARGPYGVMEPLEDAETVTPSIVVTPLLAFTRSGDRLGYGGGYYDRTLAALRQSGDVLAVGYAYGAQEVDAIPAAPLDERLDRIVTERATMQC